MERIILGTIGGFIVGIRIEDAILKCEEWFREMGMKVRLSEWGYTSEHFDAIASKFDSRPCGRYKDIDTKGAWTILKLLE